MPLVGAGELALHVLQTSSATTDADWQAARDAVKAEYKPGDLVVFAPFWDDPNGRRWFGDELAPRKNEARPDVTRYARAFEVSIRGAHDDELSGWRNVSERVAGRTTIRLWENPSPAKVITDLVERLGPETASVALVSAGAETPCTWARGAGSPGGLSVPQGPAVPGDKFTCTGGAYAGVAVLHALDHHPHLCIFATAPGMKIKFTNVTFGTSLHGHHGVQWVTERAPSHDRVTIAFTASFKDAADRPLGETVHRIGAGWTGFELPTEEWAGRTGDLVAEIEGAGARQFCFEADTR